MKQLVIWKIILIENLSIHQQHLKIVRKIDLEWELCSLEIPKKKTGSSLSPSHPRQLEHQLHHKNYCNNNYKMNTTLNHWPSLSNNNSYNSNNSRWWWDQVKTLSPNLEKILSMDSLFHIDGKTEIALIETDWSLFSDMSVIYYAIYLF